MKVTKEILRETKEILSKGKVRVESGCGITSCQYNAAIKCAISFMDKLEAIIELTERQAEVKS